MKYIDNFTLYLSENKSVETISIEDMEKFLNDKNNENISYDLIKLAQGFVVDIDGVKLKLENIDDFKTIRNMIRNSVLNDNDTLFTLFMTTHPKNKPTKV